VHVRRRALGVQGKYHHHVRYVAAERLLEEIGFHTRARDGPFIAQRNEQKRRTTRDGLGGHVAADEVIWREREHRRKAVGARRRSEHFGQLGHRKLRKGRFAAGSANRNRYRTDALLESDVRFVASELDGADRSADVRGANRWVAANDSSLPGVKIRTGRYASDRSEGARNLWSS
jgi:hypothetical protein